MKRRRTRTELALVLAVVAFIASVGSERMSKATSETAADRVEVDGVYLEMSRANLRLENRQSIEDLGNIHRLRLAENTWVDLLERTGTVVSVRGRTLRFGGRPPLTTGAGMEAVRQVLGWPDDQRSWGEKGEYVLFSYLDSKTRVYFSRGSVVMFTLGYRKLNKRPL